MDQGYMHRNTNHTLNPNAVHFYIVLLLPSAPIQGDMRQDTMTSRYKPSHIHGISYAPWLVSTGYTRPMDGE